MIAGAQVLFDDHPDPMFALDPEGRLVAVNRALTAVIGLRPTALLGLHYEPLVHPEDRTRIAGEFARVLGGQIRSYPMRGMTPEGALRRFEITNVPRVVDGVTTLVWGIARDVTQREQARAALQDSERRFRGLFEGAGAGIAIADLHGRFLDANGAYVAMVRRTADQLRELDLLQLTHPDDRSTLAQELRRLIQGGVRSFVLETRYLLPDGDIAWARASLALIRTESGTPLNITVTTEDISEATAAAEGLRRSETLRRMAGQLARVGGWSVEAHDRTVYWSEALYQILDAAAGEEPSLADAVALYPSRHGERLQVAVDMCLADGVPFDLELEIDTCSGRRIPMRAIGEAQRGADGTIERVVGAFQDISELQAASDRTAQLGMQLSAAFESMTDAVILVDRDWTITYVNVRTEERLRRPREAIVGREFWVAFPDVVGTELEDRYRHAAATQTADTVEELHYEPIDLWVQINLFPSDGGLALYFRDISDERRARKALNDREAVLKQQAALLDEAQDAIVVRDLAHRITYWNRSAERIYGWSAAEAVGTDQRGLLGDDAATFDAAMDALRSKGSWSGERRQRTRDGTPIVVDARWTLLSDEEGRPEAVLSINTDITQQKAVEQQLLRAQRMESLGTLAGGVAHDLNNVLAPILLAAELLQLDEEDEDPRSELLGTILTSAQRGADLVSQVLSFARGVEGHHTPVVVADLLHDIHVIVRDTFPKHITLTMQVADDLDTIMGDSTQIQQVLLNLAVNGRDAMPDGGNLRITADAVTLDEQYSVSTPGATGGRYLLIEVEDDGTGMPPDVRDRVFEPFFTTKPLGAGTGLGLSTAAAIVRSHRGFVHVYSEPGRGTKFSLYLPLAGHADAAEPIADVHDLARGTGQTVLVVDDEAAVRAMTRGTLEAHGYLALEARDGAEAVSVFAQHRDRIDVVLTDMMMPIMDGPATIHALKRMDPDVRIIGSSGLHGNGKVAKAMSAGVEHFLPKPYSSSRLIEVLAEILGH